VLHDWRKTLQLEEPVDVPSEGRRKLRFFSQVYSQSFADLVADRAAMLRF
jgi:hypothetical protein